MYKARPCNEHGDFLLPGELPVVHTKDQTNWYPYRNQIQFETAEFLFRRAQLAGTKIDALWTCGWVHCSLMGLLCRLWTTTRCIRPSTQQFLGMSNGRISLPVTPATFCQLTCRLECKPNTTYGLGIQGRWSIESWWILPLPMKWISDLSGNIWRTIRAGSSRTSCPVIGLGSKWWAPGILSLFVHSLGMFRI